MRKNLTKARFLVGFYPIFQHWSNTAKHSQNILWFPCTNRQKMPTLTEDLQIYNWLKNIKIFYTSVKCEPKVFFYLLFSFLSTEKHI